MRPARTATLSMLQLEPAPGVLEVATLAMVMFASAANLEGSPLTVDAAMLARSQMDKEIVSVAL